MKIGCSLPYSIFTADMNEISKKIYVAYSTVRKWHKLALTSFKMMNNFAE